MIPVALPSKEWSLSLKRPDGCNLDTGCDEAVKLMSGVRSFYGTTVTGARKPRPNGGVIAGPDSDGSKVLTLDMFVSDGECCGCCDTGHPQPEEVTAAFCAMSSGVAELCFVDPRTGEIRFAYGRPLGSTVLTDELCQGVPVRAQFEILDSRWYSRKHTNEICFRGMPSEPCFPIKFPYSFAGGQKLSKCVDAINCGTVSTALDIEVDGELCGPIEVTVNGVTTLLEFPFEGCAARLPQLAKGSNEVEICLTTAGAVDVRLCWRDAWK